jgi:Fe-S cluster assembly protein SufD
MPVVPAFAPDRAVDPAAAEAFAVSLLPSTDEEVWRYSRIDELDLGRYSPVAASGVPLADDQLPAAVAAVLGLAAGACSVGVVTVDGRVVHQRPLGGADSGLTIEPDGPPDGTGGASPDAFGLLSAAFATPLRIRTEPGAVAAPVVVVHWISGSGVAAFPRTVLDAGADSEVAVLEVVLSDDGVDALVVPSTQLRVGKAARVGHLLVQQLGTDTWQVGHLDAAVEADATLTATAAGLGGSYARLRTDCRLIGRGATGNLRAIWFGEADQTLDFRTFQEHAAPDTTSDLVYKGAVGGRSRSVYTGLIRVDENARGTDARQANRNLKLSEDAWAESVPNLEIHNNDVRCAHASSVGPVDEEQRWYLESRGVPTAAAERLIVRGFFEEVLVGLPVPAAAPALRAAIDGKLARSGLEPGSGAE